ncbi:F-box/kelch-repeat protein At3g61590-like [Curcuma longa]|uniref:F-box/kelch-repeat protein At3g61590-like n=1 Tax=Curcuma longa TaxID=136217 RepID=UPI003D9F3578
MLRDGEKEEEDKGTLLSRASDLPDELLQQVLSLFPIANIIKLGTVCKRWYDVVHSRPLLWTMMAPQKPLFFLTFFNDHTSSGHVYDPCLLRWHNFGFPGLDKSILQASSSNGLVCLMSREDRSRLVVGNPITRDWKRLPPLPGAICPDYNALALWFDRRTRGYTVVVAKCTSTQLKGGATRSPGRNNKFYYMNLYYMDERMQANYLRWNFSVHIYESSTQSWAVPFAGDLGSWIGGEEGVVCDGVLYYLIRPDTELRRPHLVAFDLAKPPSTIQSVIQEAIPAPCRLACARLINLSGKLVMVGVTVWNAQPINGLMIWELKDKTWQEEGRMTFKTYESLYTIRENFICCAAGDLVFIQSLERPMLLLMFNMREMLAEWCPYNRHFETKFFRSFCFEPRLDVTS